MYEDFTDGWSDRTLAFMLMFYLLWNLVSVIPQQLIMNNAKPETLV